MKYNPIIHRRRSIRLNGYDYSQAGLYFITICVQDKACLFGEIIDGHMVLNDAGEMVEKWYSELGKKYSDIKCDEMAVMPNHFHCIFENMGTVGADLRVCPNNVFIEVSSALESESILPNVDDISNNVSLSRKDTSVSKHGNLGEHTGSPLHAILLWFKTMTTNEYIRGVKKLGWQPFIGKLWQRNYYEHVIRNNKSYQKISDYTINNPSNWTNDKFYTI